ITTRSEQAVLNSATNTPEQTPQAPDSYIANTTQQSTQSETNHIQESNPTITNSQYTSLLAALEQIHQRFDIYDSIINNLNNNSRISPEDNETEDSTNNNQHTNTTRNINIEELDSISETDSTANNNNHTSNNKLFGKGASESIYSAEEIEQINNLYKQPVVTISENDTTDYKGWDIQALTTEKK